MSEHSPIRILEEVVIDGGEEKRHRAWPTLELTQAGDLVVAYRSGLDHHITDAGALYRGAFSGWGRDLERRAAHCRGTGMEYLHESWHDPSGRWDLVAAWHPGQAYRRG